MAEYEPRPGAVHAVAAIADAHVEINEALGGIPDTELKIEVVTPGEGQWEVQGTLKSTLDGGTLVKIDKPV